MTKTAAAKWGEDERGNWDAKAQKQDATRDVKQSLLDAGLVLCTTIRNLVIGAITTEELTLIKSQAGELEQALHDAGALPPGETVPPEGELPMPTVTSLEPSSGPDGTEILIAGTGFQPQGDSSQVKIGTHNATVLSWAEDAVVIAAVQGDTPPDAPMAVWLRPESKQDVNAGAFTFTEETEARSGSKKRK